MVSVNVNVSANEFAETMDLISELPGIVSQIESCNFSCEAGSIEMNKSFIRLKEILSNIESGLTQRTPDAANSTVCASCWQRNGNHLASCKHWTPRR